MKSFIERRPADFLFALRLSVFVLVWIVAIPMQANAQNSLTFDADLSSQSGPILSWSTTPAADSCDASGSWSGPRDPNGSETLPPLTQSSAWTLECSWGGDSIAEVSWTIPTENTDGSPYENPQETLLMWSSTEDLTGRTCDDFSGAAASSRPHPQTMHSVTGLAEGEWSFVAFAVNDAGICSSASAVAMTMIQGSSSMSDTISVAVPNAPSGISAN